ETRYLDLIITTEGIKMDLARVTAIQGWEPPETLKDVPGFPWACQLLWATVEVYEYYLQRAESLLVDSRFSGTESHPAPQVVKY
ncbi:hypothetical protein K402DRAFT_337895, partial [Aulographum hederae CBS 113979]